MAAKKQQHPQVYKKKQSVSPSECPIEDFCLCAYLNSFNCKVIQGGLSMPFRLLWPWPLFSNFTSLLLWAIDRGQSPCSRPHPTSPHTICASMGDAETGWISSGQRGSHPLWSPCHLEVSNLTSPGSLFVSKASSGLGCQIKLKGNIFFSVLLMLLLLSFAQCVG